MSGGVLRALTREAIVAGVMDHVTRLAQRPEVTGVVLFGSVAGGVHTGRSDADVMVVVGESTLPFVDRAPVYAPTMPRVPVDTFVYTLREVPRTPLAVRALISGEMLFDRQGDLARLKADLGRPT